MGPAEEEIIMEVLVAPEGCLKGQLQQVHLPRPKDNQLQQFLYDEESLNLYEMVEHFDPHRSWLVDNRLVQRGHLRQLTRVDPLYLFLPHLERLAKQSFRSLADICTTFGEENKSSGSSRLDYALRPDIDWAQVCDTKQMDGELYVRFCADKTRLWLLKKHARLVGALKAKGNGNNGQQVNAAGLELISLYLDANWTKTLAAAAAPAATK